MAENETKKTKKPTKPKGFQKGHEKYGGREPGSLNKKHLTLQEEFQKHRGIPFAVAAMNAYAKAVEQEDLKLEAEYIKMLLPYMFPKLNATTIKLDDSNGDVKARIDEMSNKLLGISSERPKDE